jgi:hypothetical protein
MKESMHMVLNHLFDAQTEFRACQVDAMMAFNPGSTPLQCMKFLDKNTDFRIKNITTGEAYPDELQAKKRTKQSSWTLNETLDAENFEVFNRGPLVPTVKSL